MKLNSKIAFLNVANLNNSDCYFKFILEPLKKLNANVDPNIIATNQKVLNIRSILHNIRIVTNLVIILMSIALFILSLIDFGLIIGLLVVEDRLE
jgi:hypothetical protein